MLVTKHLMQPTRIAGVKSHLSLKTYDPYLVLLPVGFTMPLPLPVARCALTAPFHLFLIFRPIGRLALARYNLKILKDFSNH